MKGNNDDDGRPGDPGAIRADWRVAAEGTYTSGEDDFATTLVYVIARAEGVDPIALEDPLNDYVNVGAMEQLFRFSDPGADGSEGYISFSYEEYRVVVESGGEIRVYEPV